MRKILTLFGVAALTAAVSAQFISGLDFKHRISPDRMRVRVAGSSDQAENRYYAKLADGTTTNTSSTQAPSRRSGRLMWVLGIPDNETDRKYLTVWEDSPTTEVDRQVYSRFIDVPEPTPTPVPGQEPMGREDAVTIQYMIDSGDPADLGMTTRKMMRVIRRYKMRLRELIAEDESRR